jgi:hypothetical protein
MMAGTRPDCGLVIVFQEPAGWPDALRPARSLGTEGAQGSRRRPEARDAPESPRPCRFIPPSRWHDENSAARRVFVPDGTTAVPAASGDR